MVEKSGCFMRRRNGPVDTYIGTVVIVIVVVVVVVVVVVLRMMMMTIPMSTHFHSCHELWL